MKNYQITIITLRNNYLEFLHEEGGTLRIESVIKLLAEIRRLTKIIDAGI